MTRSACSLCALPAAASRQDGRWRCDGLGLRARHGGGAKGGWPSLLANGAMRQFYICSNKHTKKRCGDVSLRCVAPSSRPRGAAPLSIGPGAGTDGRDAAHAVALLAVLPLLTRRAQDVQRARPRVPGVYRIPPQSVPGELGYCSGMQPANPGTAAGAVTGELGARPRPSPATIFRCRIHAILAAAGPTGTCAGG